MAAATKLRLSRSLSVPLEYATDATAILGKRGSGKTNTAVVAVEEMVAAGIPVVVVDTVGVWWGLRSSADGEKPGLPVIVFGGEHGDVPLEEKSGQVIADAILDHGLSAVVDTSGLGKAAAKRFLLAFVTRIYHRKSTERTPLHVVFDEADELAPQRPDSRSGPEGVMLLSAMEDFVRRGRSRGLGCTLVTQRPAVLNKDVLTQVEVLIAMRMTGTLDIKAIDDWTRASAAEDEDAATVKATLAKLETGTGWVWSPQWLNIFERVTFRERTTFDSSATPKVGEVRVEPKARAEVDLAKLGEQIAATMEKAKADDPKELRRQIAEQKTQIAKLQQDLADRPDPKAIMVEVPVLTDDDHRRLSEQTYLLHQQVLDLLRDGIGGVNLAVEKLAALAAPAVSRPLTGPPRPGVPRPAPRPQPAPLPRVTEHKPLASSETPRRTVTEAGTLPKAQRLVLTVLAQRGTQTQQQVAMLSGYAVNGGGFNNALGALRSAGMIEGTKDALAATDHGLDALGEFEPMPSGQSLIDFWLSKSSKAERLILEYLISVWPAAADREEIAAATGYEPNGGGFNNAIGRLRTLTLLRGERGQPIQVDASLGEARDA
ncbi:MAG: hypothetical protein ABIQ01_05795 [Pseudolysinimonas sp.]